MGYSIGTVSKSAPEFIPQPPVFHPVHRAYLNVVGRRILDFIDTFKRLGAFSLITLGVTVTKFYTARQVIHPLIRQQIFRTGVQLLPMVVFMACALGLVIIGQTAFLLNKLGYESYLGTVMVTVVVRELGPILAATLVMGRIGTANVIELGMARAQGEVEALEALGIDPIHYLVMPRVIGMALSIFSLTVFLILFALASGYLFTFIQEIPMPPSRYMGELAMAMMWEDFVLLALKTMAFGTLIAMVTCYEGLSQPLRLEDVAGATTRAVVKCVISMVFLDALFIVCYVLL
jgi:phospholipid/cholesterol/gamma-HCH transport system permease protein